MYNNKPLAIDLFAGAGGVSEGLIQAGFHIIYSNEINSDAALTYNNRHKQLGLINGENTILEVDDIRNISGKSILNQIKALPIMNNDVTIDAIFGGPPCQGFSRAGKQSANDVRNKLFSEYLRIISEVQPKYVVFENVTGITDIKFTNYKSYFDNQIYVNHHALDIIVNELTKINYVSLDYQILNSSDFGVPQNRNRFILIAYKSGESIPSYPIATHKNRKITITDALADLLPLNSTSHYQNDSVNGRTPNISTGIPISEHNFYNNEKTSHFEYIRERFSLLKEGESSASLRRRIMTDGINIELYPHLLEYFLLKSDRSKNNAISIFKDKTFTSNDLDILLTKKNSRTKLKKDSPSSTIVTLPDDIISPFENRIFSVRELARLQSFDDSFIFYGKRTTGAKLRTIEAPQYTQVGNAVPPLLAKAIATEIIKAINNED